MDRLDTRLDIRLDTRRSLAAYMMHKSVPPERWCVTSFDLNLLRHEVLLAIQRGHIQPSCFDNFDSLDREYGPNIYTVNDQHIKLVTSNAGKMSWALMRHSEGLECDLFISHAWQEGVFEFLRKVQYSWPRGLKNAWCCVLANPQNLNISWFLKAPNSSPFAVALNASNVVLVVPNRHQSVYTRLWCAYEAYLAQEEGKIILIAHNSTLHYVGDLQYMALAAVMGTALGIFTTLHVSHALGFGVSVAGLLSLTIEHSTSRLVINFLCEMFCWLRVTNWDPFFPYADMWHFPWEVCPWHVRFFIHEFFFLTGAFFFLLMEVDRIHGKSSVLEAEQLRQHYKGSILYAECSQQEDAINIHSEIGDKIGSVDYAIHVLLTAGMSTPTLRDIARAGVDIEDAAYTELTGAATFLGPFDMMTSICMLLNMAYLGGKWHLAILPAVCFLSKLILLYLICRSPTDERCFILKVMAKSVVMMIVVFLMLCILPLNLTMTAASHLWLAISNLFYCSIFAFAVLGIRGTAELPCGLSLLQLFFARGSKALAAFALYGRRHSHTNLESDSTDSETD
ncbi:Uncharacterized protein SCF082_LOCUS41001 [Durusdinium trenchii]|uniref:Uncharacterized protein n=1 Tax=Durusdinium trenchii TaxID=1381693 RepID=A0ABP0QEN3_9DINO